MTGKELQHLTLHPQIMTLKLGGNKIKTIDELKCLVSQQKRITTLQTVLKNLTNLDLIDNDVTKVENYRDKVFALFPKLDVSV